MKTQDAAPRGKYGGERERHADTETDGEIVVVDRELEAFDLAGQLPIRFGICSVDRRADEHERQDDKEGQTGRDKVDEIGWPQFVAPFPEPVKLDGQQTEAVKADCEQVAEEESCNKSRRCREAQRQRSFAQRHPAGERPEREPDAEHIIQHADLEDAVVEKENGDERQRRPASEQRAMERERAGDDHKEGEDRECLPRFINAHDAVEQRQQQVDHQIGDDLPVDQIKAREKRIAVDGIDDVDAREVVDVIRQRRQLMRQQRNAGNDKEPRKERKDRTRAQIAGIVTQGPVHRDTQ
jgi:hypothetical protein